jgi:cysteine desulfurase
MGRALDLTGNPSSIHAGGRAARAMVEAAREAVAELILVPAQTIIFTSGGTEANALAIDSAVAAGSRRLIIGATEHDCVTETARASGVAVEVWPVDAHGVADLTWLSERLVHWDSADGRPFAALMLANNETGVIQPTVQAAEILWAHDGWLHVDAVQAAGKIRVDGRGCGADSLALSAHKLGGPQGVGALTFGPRAILSRRLHGGGQERGRRAGTENLSGIAGFGAAAQAAGQDLVHMAAQAAWRDAAATYLTSEAGITVVGEGAKRLPNTLCLARAGFAADLQVMALDLAGVMVSTGSACSSGKVRPSPVLSAMSLDDLAGSALRISGGWATTKDDWNRFAQVWLQAFLRHQSRRPASAA